MKPSLFYRSVAVAVCASLLSSIGLPQVAEANFWKERHDAQLAMLPNGIENLPLLRPSPVSSVVSRTLSPGLEARIMGPAQQKLRSILAALPASLGSVRDIAVAKPDAPVLVHVQDIHQNFEAQKNIEDLISGLAAGKSPDFVALEAAFGPVDVAPLRSFPDTPSLKTAAAQMLEENKLAGPVTAALTMPSPALPLIGVDDERAYRANVSAYRRSLAGRQPLQQRLHEVERATEQAKANSFNSALMSYDRKVTAYRRGDVALGDYAEAIAANTASVPDAVATFLKAVRMEKSLNFESVEAERARLLEKLVRHLSVSDARQLTDLSTSFRQGDLTHAQFYSSLKNLCARAGVTLAAYPAMDAYVRYVVLAESISGEEVLVDLDRLETNVYDRLAISDDEKRLIEKSRLVSALNRLFTFALTPDEWSRYESHASAATQLGFSAQDLEPYESFYRAAHDRDRAMVNNLLASARARKSQFVLLVAGGFHSNGVKRLAKEAGFTVVTFAPRITKVTDESGSAYLSVFAQEQTPLEKLVAGQPLFLAKEITTADFVGVALESTRFSLHNAIGNVMSTPAVAWLMKFLRPMRWAFSRAEMREGELSLQGEAFDVIVSRDSTIKVALVKPFFENIILWAARPLVFAAVQWALPYLSLNAQAVITKSIVATIFSLSHMRKGYGWRFLMGYVYLELLDDAGFLASTAVHMLHNTVILAAAMQTINAVRNSRPVLKLIALLAHTPLTNVTVEKNMPYDVVGSNHYDNPAMGKTFVIEGNVIDEKSLENPARLWGDDERIDDAEKARRTHAELARIDEALLSVKAAVNQQLGELTAIENEQERQVKMMELFSTLSLLSMIIQPGNKAREQQTVGPWAFLKEQVASGVTVPHALYALSQAYLNARDTNGELFGLSAKAKLGENGYATAWFSFYLSRIAAEEQADPQLQKETPAERAIRLQKTWIELKPPNPLKNATHPVILVAKKPDNVLMEWIIKDTPEKVLAIIVVGDKMPLAHWAAVLAKNKKISIVTVKEDVPNAVTAYVDAAGDKVLVNLTRHMAQKMNDEILERQELYIAMVATRDQEPLAKVQGVLGELPEEKSGERPENAPFNEINNVFGGQVGLVRTEYLAQGNRPASEAAFYDDIGKKLLRMAQTLKGRSAVRTFDFKPNDKDSWLLKSGNKLGGLRWLLDSDEGRRAYIELTKQVILVETKLRAEGVPYTQGLDYFPPDVRSVKDIEDLLALNQIAYTELIASGAKRLARIRFGAMIEYPDLKPETIEQIVQDPAVEFISIGTRDLTENTVNQTVFEPGFRRTIRDVALACAKKGIPLRLCGMQAANEYVITDVYAMKELNDATLPIFTVEEGDEPRLKSFVRALYSLGRDNLNPAIHDGDYGEGSVKALKAATAAIREKRTAMLRKEPAYLEARDRHAVQRGPKSAIRAHLEMEKSGVVYVTDVDVSGPKGEVVSYEEAGLVGFAYSLLTPVALMLKDGLKYRGSNRVLRYLARLGQHFIDRKTMLADARYRYRLAHVGGRNDKFDLVHAGATGLFGYEDISVVAPSENISSEGFANSLTRVYVNGEIPVIPGGYAVIVEASPLFDSADIKTIIGRGRIINRDDFDMEKMRKAAVVIAKKKSWGGRIPNIAVDDGTSLFDDNKIFSSIAIGQPGGHDVFIRKVRLSEAAVSAGIRMKLGGSMAAVPVPAEERRHFSPIEKGTFAKFQINPKSMWTQQTLMRAENPDDIAIAIGIPRTLTNVGWIPGLKENEIPGTSVDETGTVTTRVLWLARGQVRLYQLQFSTNINDLKKELDNEPNSLKRSEIAAKLALAWIELGELERAQILLKDWLGKAHVQRVRLEEKRWAVVSLYFQGHEKIRSGVNSATSLTTRVADVVGLYEKAQRILSTEPGLADLRDAVGLPQIIRRYHYWLANENIAAAYSNGSSTNPRIFEALRSTKKALKFSDGGYDTRIIENRMHLKGLVDPYEQWLARQWANKKREPSLRIRMGKALELFSQQRAHLDGYDKYLSKHGGNLLLSILCATALATEPLDVQQRILNYLLFNERGKSLLNDLQLVTGSDSKKALASELAKHIDRVQATAPKWLHPLPSIPTDRVVLRSLLAKIFPKIQAYDETHDVLLDLVRIANAKARILTVLGDQPRRVMYLKEAVDFIDLMLQYPRTLAGEDVNPIPAMRVFSSVMEQYVEVTSESGWMAKKQLVQKRLFDSETFHSFLKGLTYEGLTIYSDDQIEKLEIERRKIEPEHRAHLELLASQAGQTTPIGNASPELPTGALPWFGARNPMLIGAWAGALIVGLNVLFRHSIVWLAIVNVGILAFLFFGHKYWGIVQRDGSLLRGSAVSWSMAAQATWTAASSYLGVLIFMLGSAFPMIANDPIAYKILVTAAVLAGASVHAYRNRSESLTPEQRALYDQILGSLSRVDGKTPLGMRIGLDLNIRPTHRWRGRFWFGRGIRTMIRGIVQNPIDSFDDVVASMLKEPKVKLRTAFLNKNENGKWDFSSIETTLLKMKAQAKSGETALPLLLTLTPQAAGDMDVRRQVRAWKDAYPKMLATQTLGEGLLKPRSGDSQYYYEDLFNAFAQDGTLPQNVTSLLRALAKGTVPTGMKIVQVNASPIQFRGAEQLLQAILLLLPLSDGRGVLINLETALLAAKNA
jgi:hypothetical protein